MAPPQPSPQLFVLAALAGLLSPTEATAESARGAGAGCPEGLWPLPPQVSPRVTYTRMSPRQKPSMARFPPYHGHTPLPSFSGPVESEDVSFLYHPCAHPWLKFQLSLLAHIYMAQPLLAPDSSLTRDRPLVLEAGGVVLEMAWLEPTWAAYWLKRRRWKKQRKKAPTSVFTLRSWRPPGTEVASRGPRQHSSGGARRRGLRAAFGHQPTLSAPRLPSASPWSLETRQPMLETPGEGGNGPFVPIAPLLPRGPEGNASSRLEAQVTKGQSSPGGCTCPSHAAPAPRAGAPPRAARGPTPRTEEAAWAAMALTFLLVLLTLATLCTRLHRNFRRGESIYWGPVTDSQDTVAAVLKRRLLMLPRRVRRSRRRPLLPPAQDSGTDGDSSD